MTLRDSLNERHHRELTFMKALWLGEDTEILDRQELTDRLERAMLCENTLALKMARLDIDEKGVLKTLLHSDGFSAESSRLRRAERNGEWRADKTTDILLSLERKGFVAMAKEVDWWQKKWYTARIPFELARMLGSLCGIDNRVREQILSLRQVLGSLPARRLEDIAASAGASHGDREHLLDSLIAALSHAARVEARIASLPDELLRRAAKSVLCSHGGLLLLSRFDKNVRARANTYKHQWRTMLEDALVGTIGQVSLVDAGLAVEGEHFVIFMENVDGYFRTSHMPRHLLTPPKTEAVDFIIDLSSIVCFVRHHEAKVTRIGTVYKSTASKLIAHCVMKDHVASEPHDLLNFKIALCRKLGLLGIDSNRRLTVGPSARTWESRSLREKLGLIYRRIIHADRRGRGERWVNAVQRGLLALLPSLDHGGWGPRQGLVMRATARYIIDAVHDGRNHAHADSALNHRQYNYRTLEQLRSVLESELVYPLCIARIVEYGSKEDMPFAMRLSTMGCLLLDIVKEGEQSQGNPRIIAAPDFEVLLFPEGAYYELKQTLAAFCKPVKTEQVFHFKVTRERVAHAVASGMTSEGILGLLRSHCENELPQNVVYSIQDWAKRGV